MRRIILVVTMFLLLVIAIPVFAQDKPNADPGNLPMEGANTDNPSHPLGEKQAALK